MTTLTGRTVVITGAAGAIGAEVARQIAQAGACVALVDREAKPITKLVDEVTTAGGDACGGALDASDASAMSDFVAETERRFAPVDGLVSVAGLFRIEDFTATTRAGWDDMVRANLYTAMASASAVLPRMLEHGQGAIVTFASTAGEYGSIRPAAPYAAAKAAVIGFTKSLAREVSPQGVRVNCISPGPIDTAMFQAGGAADRAAAAARTLVGRMGRPADLARAVVYLLSDDASFVTGEVLRVNGGSLI